MSTRTNASVRRGRSSPGPSAAPSSSAGSTGAKSNSPAEASSDSGPLATSSSCAYSASVRRSCDSVDRRSPSTPPASAASIRSGAERWPAVPWARSRSRRAARSPRALRGRGRIRSAARTYAALRPAPAPTPRPDQPPLLPPSAARGARVRIAVLGATGFIGRALVPVLAERADVVAVSRRGGDAPRRKRSRGRRRRDGPGRHAPRARGSRCRLLPRPLARRIRVRRDRPPCGHDRCGGGRARRASSQIVFLGGLGDDAPDLSPHLRSRVETAAVLVAGGVPVTTLRAAVVVGQRQRRIRDDRRARRPPAR